MGLPGKSVPIIVEPVRLPEPARVTEPDREPLPEPTPQPVHPTEEPVPQR